MKLKYILIAAFLTLTFIPIGVASVLLYKSGYDLSKKSYMENLIESINVQSDYISQTMENNMISDYRFANKEGVLLSNKGETEKEELYGAFRSYLEASEDKIAVAILTDENHVPVYTMGEKDAIDEIEDQMSDFSEQREQKIVEFKLGESDYSLGIITPVWDRENVYKGSLVSVYNPSYIFKIISSYYKIADTSTFLCRADGSSISYQKFSNEIWNEAIDQVLYKAMFTQEDGIIDKNTGNVPVSGYYKNIYNSPWYLIGFLDEKLVESFAGQFIWIYILIIIGVLMADIILAFYFSNKVVEPINQLIHMMDRYQGQIYGSISDEIKSSGYFETKYLTQKFCDLLKRISLFQHNYEGIYQLYQSSDMGDTNIDIDVKKQTIYSSKEEFRKLMEQTAMSEEDCIVERFIKCFSVKDQINLTELLETMRDEHLLVTREAEVYTPLGEKWFHTLVVPMYEDESLSRLFIQLRDISGFKKQEIKSLEQASRDPLTKLYNRAGFAECADKILQSGEVSGVHGLLFLDMNYFKKVNDNFGHNSGDDLLCSIGKTLLHDVGETGVVSRFGGDEFAVFLPNTSIENMVKIKETLEKDLQFPFQAEDKEFLVSASIGYSTWNKGSSDSLSELMQRADDSMYKAKRELKKGKKESV